MKENSYLAHYGRKGMKWGKHIFGRVPGIPGGPEVSEYETGRLKEMVDSAKAADANIKKVQNYVLAATNRNLSDTVYPQLLYPLCKITDETNTTSILGIKDIIIGKAIYTISSQTTSSTKEANSPWDFRTPPFPSITANFERR